jgi:hypothetical protein
MAANEIFYNHASSAAPASGVVTSQNQQIPTKHSRNQAAADVIQAANSMPSHVNSKIPVRQGGSKKNGPSSSIMNQNNLMQFNSNPGLNKQA